MAESGSLTVYPGAYDRSDYNYRTITNETSPVGKGSTNADAYCSISAATGTGTITFIYWPFDLSSIPNDAIIDSVVCVVASSISDISTTYLKNSQMQLYTGNTAKGSPTSISSTTRKEYTLNVGSWTRTELQNCRLRLQTQRASGYTSAKYIIFYGADLTVTYTYQSEKFMLKLGGAWHDIARVFKKVNGIWVEQTDLANVIEDGVRYKNGGEYVAPVVVTIAGSFYYEYSWVKVNGKQYTSATSVEVEPGTEVQIYTSSAFSSLKSSCGVKLNGTAVLSGAGTYTHIADRSCTITMKENVSDGRAYYSAEITTGSGSSTNLISFTIAGTSYQAEEGMTWAEWVSSEYNTGYFSLQADKVAGPTAFAYITSADGVRVKPTDVIIPNHVYTLT